jgi:hypothetical protein
MIGETMNETELKRIAQYVAAEISRTETCVMTGACSTFDAETVDAIRRAALAYNRACKFGLWSGGIILGAVLLALVGGVMAALWQGVRHGLTQP